MKQRLAIIILLLSVAGCSGTGGNYARENYIVDLDSGSYCIEGRQACYLLSLIAPSYRDGWIADAYGLPGGYYAWDADKLAELVLNPPDQSYQAEALPENRYRVPPTFATHMVWDVLALEYYELYQNDDGPGSSFIHWPQPRRF